MIDEMTNPALIEHVVGSEDSTETEIELAHRLGQAIREIEDLVNTIQRMEAAVGQDARG